ncbi:MAG TPA: SPOR domain-containing protein [Haliscomenobacter sp.]|uniref:SPOR domain-containing protein n=1 Tax=Haliscomenobacter sp. TaxID=2717303 RepID=UPI002C064E8E|nr:SPOR domain-containing protein [Haliscomenobacter sp.]HOY17580.1 SPOR domain-containing protein [Haliscomenobacter sp.]HPH18434.1 SPOR domain-containing protein [Haliscomenobacter sp.]
MLKKLVFLLLNFSLICSLNAQTAKKLMKQGEEAFTKGNYVQAADFFEKSWLKGKKPEAVFKAGEAYYLLRNYRKASEAYLNVKDKNDQFPLVGLKYARSLKQDGQYDKASKAFSDFRDNYNGDGKAVLEDIVQSEIQGCELGKLLPAQAQQGLEVNHAGAGVNTSDNEFGPLPIDKGLLYFSSTIGGTARIYRSSLADNVWGKGSTPENFPVIQKGQYCHGSLTPDGQRFYFTICDAASTFSNTTTRCEIYVIRKQAAGWSAPEMLPEAINAKGTTATQPNVVQAGGKEILYFASNRTGGRGGMDLWYAERPLSATGNSFSTPINLGAAVNTLGDEMTPYFSPGEGVLYFASNGQTSIGGFDIFSSRGELSNWAPADNLGLPYNSPADDYYYIKHSDGEGGFLVSNRIVAGEKLTTKDDDIFEIKNKLLVAKLQGNVFAQETGEPINKYLLTLYEIRADESESILLNREFNASSYDLELLPNRKFRVEITAQGYATGAYSFVTDNPNGQAYGQPLMLVKLGGGIANNNPANNNPPNTNPGNNPPTGNPNPNYPPNTNPGNNPPPNNYPGANPSGGTYTARGAGPADKEEYATDAPRYEGEYYKIQLVALSNYRADDKRYTPLTELGNLQTETILSKKMTRVLVATFYTKDDAKRALAAVKKKGFTLAFIVKYNNGERYGRVNL